MKYTIFCAGLLLASVTIFAMEDDDDLAITLQSMEAGTGGRSRAAEIRTHFGELVRAHKEKIDDSDLATQLTELDDTDFQKLVTKKATRSPGGGWFGRSESKNDQLVFLMTELGRLRLENQRIAEENEELIREKYDRCKVVSWSIATLCFGSTALNGIFGSSLASLLSDPGTTETFVNAFNATTTS